MLEWITHHFTEMSPGVLYIVLFVCSFVENVLPPVPGDTVTVFAAYLVGRTQKHLIGVLLSTTLGSTAGFMAFYFLGRLIDPDYFIRKDFRILRASSFRAAGEWFQKHGYWIVLLNRFLSGIRSVISIVCGVYRLPWVRVLILSFVGCAVWNGLLVWAGYLLGANWMLIEKILTQYSRILLALAALLVGLWLFRRRRASSGTSG